MFVNMSRIEKMPVALSEKLGLVIPDGITLIQPAQRTRIVFYINKGTKKRRKKKKKEEKEKKERRKRDRIITLRTD